MDCDSAQQRMCSDGFNQTAVGGHCLAVKCFVRFDYMYFSHVGVSKSCEFNPSPATTSKVVHDVVMRCSCCFRSTVSWLHRQYHINQLQLGLLYLYCRSHCYLSAYHSDMHLQTLQFWWPASLTLAAFQSTHGPDIHSCPNLAWEGAWCLSKRD